MECRSACGACCMAPSINSPIPGMEEGKPAGIACIHLDEEKRCGLYGLSHRPAFCLQFQAERAVCGFNTDEAMTLLNELERQTGPAGLGCQ